jgi:hypothetical protein
MNRLNARRLVGVALVAVSVTACGLDNQEMPIMSGPSGLGLGITMAASPDQLPRDGVSQAVVTLTMRDAAGQVLANRHVALSVSLGAALTQSEVVTGAGGQATFGVIAPTADVVIDGNQIVLAATPVGSGDAANTTSRVMTIGLTGPRNETAPTPDFDWTPNPLEINQVATFDATKTQDERKACQDACTYEWNFDDGALASGRVVAHAFTVARPYSVALTVTDQAGVAVTLRRLVVPTAPAVPTVDLAVVPAAPLLNQTATFTANAKAAANHSVVRYEWSFGDGSSATTSAGIVDHVFTSAGNFAVTIRAIDDVGQIGSTSKLISVGSGIVASFFVTPTDPTLGQTIFVDGSGSITANGTTVASYEWNWGDGVTETTAVPTASHLYASKNTWVIRLKVTDSIGGVGTFTKEITIK